MHVTNANITNYKSDDGGATSWDKKNIDNVDNEVNNDEYDNKEITERSVTTKPGRLKINWGAVLRSLPPQFVD